MGRSYQKYLFDANNRVSYYRDREGYVRTVERNSDNNVVCVARGLKDVSDAKTLAETTSRYRDDGRIQYKTVWKSARGVIDRNAPPIAGIGGVASADGVTTQYVYDDRIFDESRLDSSAGPTVNTFGGGTAQIPIQRHGA